MEGFEPPTPGFGDPCSNRTELHPYKETCYVQPKLFGLAVQGMFAVTRAELLHLQTVRLSTAVFGGGVVVLLALGTLERNDRSDVFRHDL